MKLRVTKGPIKKNIILPTSKSWANRYLILAAVSKNVVTIRSCPESTDVENLIKALITIGLDIEREGSSVIVKNSFPECESATKDQSIDLLTGDGGTTNRFLLALLSKGEKEYKIKTSPDFAKRPNGDLFKLLKKNGVEINLSPDYWVSVRGNGGIKTKEKISVNCSKSTQFLSGLLLAYPENIGLFEAENLNSSFDYLEMTKEAVKQSRNSSEFVAPVDFSSLSYPISFVSDGGKIKIENCFDVDPFQADSFLISFLKKKGVEFIFSESGLEVNAKKFDYSTFELECSKFPDLVPALVFVALLCNGDSTLSGLEVLTHKESDRFTEITKILSNCGASYKLDGKNKVTITGGEELLCDTDFDLPPDHRMIFLASMILKKFGAGTVNNIEHVNKSYPEFFQDFNICD